MKKILVLILVVASLYSCKKEENYEKFAGEYDIVSNGSINASILTFSLLDTTLVNEPGTVIIKKGDNSDELFMYVETGFMTSIAPLGVYAEATTEGDSYEMKSRNLTINLPIEGLPLSITFNVEATGDLTDDNNTLTSEVKFTGGLVGTMTVVGTKK